MISLPRMEESDLVCSVCQDSYDEARQRTPRNLGCGHAVCTSCVEQIIQRYWRCWEVLGGAGRYWGGAWR